MVNLVCARGRALSFYGLAVAGSGSIIVEKCACRVGIEARFGLYRYTATKYKTFIFATPLNQDSLVERGPYIFMLIGNIIDYGA